MFVIGSRAGLTTSGDLFILSWSTPKTQSAHEWALELGSGADFACNLHYSSNRTYLACGTQTKNIIYINIYIYIYQYIYVILSMHINIYIYIYVYICVRPPMGAPDPHLTMAFGQSITRLHV